MSTAAQILANRANAEKSTGPKTEAGKAKSSLNAVKTGLTGRTVLLPSEDAAAYQAHIDRLFTQFAPANDDERALVQVIADTDWRLMRIPSLELGIYAIGRRELGDQFADEEDEAVRKSLIDAQIFINQGRHLRALSTQEARLRRQRETDRAELAAKQKERERLASIALYEATELYLQAKRNNQPFDPAEFGFEFSLSHIEERIANREKRTVRKSYLSAHEKMNNAA